VNAPAARPDYLHVGSGKNFRTEALNIDISPHCNPDIVLDISKPADFAARHETRRFGSVALERGGFRRITAFDLLEHLRDLPQAMRNFFDLLNIGGELELSVPYDLSLGAWQDPTHVRGFNENSWLYYTKWAWYLGWREERFDLVNLHLNLSDFGQTLKEQGTPMETAIRTPRAVNSMKVILRKRKATEAEIAEHDLQFRSYLAEDSADEVWAVA
jgi:SAM-dependent methyltransferase